MPRKFVWLLYFIVAAFVLLNAQDNKQDDGKALVAGRFVNSTTDANGNQHSTASAVRGNGAITCTKATQSVNQGQTSACYVVTDSATRVLPRGQNMGTGTGGTLTLTCNGQGYLTCQVRIDD
jgi:hypothetical protein